MYKRLLTGSFFSMFLVFNALGFERWTQDEVTQFVEKASENGDGYKAFAKAIEKGDLELAEKISTKYELGDIGNNISVEDVVKAPSTKVLDYLEQKGISFDPTWINDAAKSGNSVLVDYLLSKKNADINNTHTGFRESEAPYYLALENGYYSLAQRLQKKGAVIDPLKADLAHGKGFEALNHRHWQLKNTSDSPALQRQLGKWSKDQESENSIFYNLIKKGQVFQKDGEGNFFVPENLKKRIFDEYFYLLPGIKVTEEQKPYVKKLIQEAYDHNLDRTDIDSKQRASNSWELYLMGATVDSKDLLSEDFLGFALSKKMQDTHGYLVDNFVDAFFNLDLRKTVDLAIAKKMIADQIIKSCTTKLFKTEKSQKLESVSEYLKRRIANKKFFEKSETSVEDLANLYSFMTENELKNKAQCGSAPEGKSNEPSRDGTTYWQHLKEAQKYKEAEQAH